MGERYRLDKRVAAGGVGQVWRATDLLLSRPVAVKVLRPEYADHPETLERFRKEAMHAGALSHPHVAQVYDYGPAGPGWPPYLVLEFVDGPSLADILVVEPVVPEFALDVVAQAAEGLYAAHRAGLVHRDVKPGNLLISSEGVVKVTDFGIAHAAGQAPVTAPNLVMGTTQYMAPERIAGGQGTPASDVYALGIVLHECLTGEPPYEGGPAEVMAAHLYMPLPLLPAEVPPEVQDLVDRLTAKDPAQRMSDARELAGLAAELRDAIRSGRLASPANANGAANGAGRLGGLGASALPGAGLATALAPDFLPGGDSGPGAAGPGNGARGEAAGPAEPAHATEFGSPPASDERPDPWANPVSGSWSVPGPAAPAAGPDERARDSRRPGGRRHRVAALAIVVALLIGVGLGALLVSGAFNASPTANPGPASTTPGASGPAGSVTHGDAKASGSAGGGTGGAPAASPGASSPRAKASGKKPAATPSARASASASAAASGGAGASASASAGASPSVGPVSSPTSSPVSSPAQPPASSPASSPTPAPSTSTTAPSTCILIICL
jgi:serine/threonine-protein kinase